ncbi:MAG TPA: SOS response-associated peptidase [Elusimicrobiales bacterium]|nr:SOS response-associated peptidase [Elusimicrobiales bacterium]
MCVRYSQIHEAGELAERFGVKPPSSRLRPSYNISAGREAAVVAGGVLRVLKWGFVPCWAGSGIKEGLLSARAEGIASRPAFRAAFYKSRCLVPADGFYEWGHTAGERIPYRFEFRDGRVFAMAGLYDAETGTYAVVTCAANALVRSVHHRMPVILDGRGEKLWLDMRRSDTEELLPALRACDSSLMRGYKVSSLVDSPDNDSPDCLRPLEP